MIPYELDPLVDDDGTVELDGERVPAEDLLPHEWDYLEGPLLDLGGLKVRIAS